MQKYHKSVSKERKIICRVCRKEVVAQNYRDHLGAKHPEENSSNLRVYGQASLFFPQGRQKQQDSVKDSNVRDRSRSPAARTDEASDQELEGGNQDAEDMLDIEEGQQTEHIKMLNEALRMGEVVIKEKLEDILTSVGWDQVQDVFSAWAGRKGLDRSQLLALGVMVDFVSRLLEKDGMEDEKEVAGSLLEQVLLRLGEERIKWLDLSDMETALLQKLVLSERSVPMFVRNSLCVILEEKRNTFDENANNMEDDMKTVVKKLDEVIAKITAEPVPVKECRSVLEEALKKILLIKSHMNAKEVVASLEKAVEEFKELSVVKQEVEIDVTVCDPKAVLEKCRSINDIEEQLPFLSFAEQVLKCNICGQTFGYDQEKTDLSAEKISGKFSNLKFSLHRHLGRPTHIAAAEKLEASEKMEEEMECKERTIGLRAGSLCYYLSSQGIADRHYPMLVHLLQSMGLEMGSLNHSRRFPRQFLKVQASVIRDRVHQFLGSRLVATGHLPPVNLLCDKATYRHWGRLFVGGTTVVPGAEELLQAVYLASPRCGGSSGEAVKNCIVNIIDGVVKAEQIMGSSGDGATVHCKVWEKVKAHLEIEGGSATKDGMHNAATVDTQMRSEKGPEELQWENDMTRDMSLANNYINWGEGWHLFFKVGGFLHA